jgi:Rrf2 family protein
MIPSQTGEYALRAMAWLVSQESNTAVRAADLSDETEIPPDYLLKILRRLVLAGILDSQKGRGGGFSLRRRPEEILFKEILAAVDGYPSADRCSFGWGTCNLSDPCPLHGAWSEMVEAFSNWASKTTLADVRDGQWSATRGSRRRRARKKR